MAGFRLTMARQLGEQIATELGFTQLPIIPKKIAELKGIEVQEKPADVPGVSGAIIFAGDKVTLIYSNEHNNEGFENFSISHELGHYFLPGHPEEISKQGGAHCSRSGFTQNISIELEADFFASGLLLPSALTRKLLSQNQIGLDGILELAATAHCSCTAAAIRAAQCSPYPVAVIVSQNEQVAYAFMSNAFKDLGKLSFLKKGTPLPACITRRFNADTNRVLRAERDCNETSLADWFDGPSGIVLDEEVIGLGRYGYTLTVLSSDSLSNDPQEEEDEEEALQSSWTPHFAYNR